MMVVMTVWVCSTGAFLTHHSSGQNTRAQIVGVLQEFGILLNVWESPVSLGACEKWRHGQYNRRASRPATPL